jgi:excisionase family DNA binding protein
MANPNENRKAARDVQAAWLKASRVAAELDVSVRTVKTWIAQGKVEAIRLTPNGEWRISRASLDAWLESLRSRCSPRDDTGTVAGS